MAVRLSYILAERGSQRDKLCEAAHISLDDELLRILECRVILKLLTRVKWMKHTVNRILWQLLRLAILMEVDQFLAENL